MYRSKQWWLGGGPVGRESGRDAPLCHIVSAGKSQDWPWANSNEQLHGSLFYKEQVLTGAGIAGFPFVRVEVNN